MFCAALSTDGSIFSVERNTLLEPERDSGCDVTNKFLVPFVQLAYYGTIYRSKGWHYTCILGLYSRNWDSYPHKQAWVLEQ